MAKNLEQNNIEAQLKLCREIIDEYGQIIYHVKENGMKLQKLISTRQFDKNVPVVNRNETFANLTVEEMLDIAINLTNESKFEKLGNLAEGAVDKIRSNKELLQILNK